MKIYLVISSFEVEAKDAEDAIRQAANELPSGSIIESISERVEYEVRQLPIPPGSKA